MCKQLARRLAFACILAVLGGLHATAAEDAPPTPPTTIGKIVPLTPEFGELMAEDAQIEVLGGGFAWSEGPLWLPYEGYLLFSDIPRNRIVQWTPGRGISIFLEPSGYTGSTPFTGPEPGTNGLALDRRGRLVMCEHGNRRIGRLERNGNRTVLADRYQGKRLNSPNDLIFKSNGDLYFTDPPYGLPKQQLDDPAGELGFCGVYRLTEGGELTLLTKEMTRPNGIGFSPDEKTLYVAQSDPKAAVWKAFPVREDGTLGEGRTFFDATEWMGQRPGSPDGLAVDVHGNIWTSAPGGVIVLSPEGKLLGRLDTGERTSNCAFGEDGSTLFITVHKWICKVRTKTRGLVH